MIHAIRCAHCGAPLPLEWATIPEYAPRFCSAGCALTAKRQERIKAAAVGNAERTEDTEVPW